MFWWYKSINWRTENAFDWTVRWLASEVCLKSMTKTNYIIQHLNIVSLANKQWWSLKFVWSERRKKRSVKTFFLSVCQPFFMPSAILTFLMFFCPLHSERVKAVSSPFFELSLLIIKLPPSCGDKGTQVGKHWRTLHVNSRMFVRLPPAHLGKTCQTSMQLAINRLHCICF